MLRARIGNGVAKELTWMTHGHEQRTGDSGAGGGRLGGRVERRKN